MCFAKTPPHPTNNVAKPAQKWISNQWWPNDEQNQYQPISAVVASKSWSRNRRGTLVFQIAPFDFIVAGCNRNTLFPTIPLVLLMKALNRNENRPADCRNNEQPIEAFPPINFHGHSNLACYHITRVVPSF